MLLIFVQKKTPRITYTFKHVFTHMLGISIGFATKIEDFIAHDGPKLSYGKQPLGNELYFQSTPLMFEQGFSDVEPQVQVWGNTVGFFKVTDKSALPYDIFAATFYLLSRYEEYAPHVKDSEGRYPATESMAHKQGFLNKPVIDFWVERLRGLLKDRFSTLLTKQGHMSLCAIIAIPEAYQYKRKGIMRTFFGGFRDVFTFRWRSAFKRFKVITYINKDPNDVYDKLIDFGKRHRVGFKYMFQLSDYSKYDKNISHHRRNFQSLIKSLGDYAEIGMLSGYYSTFEKQILLQEKKRLEVITNRPLLGLLNNKYPMNLPETQNHIADIEIPNTYSMGYPEAIGFRAGTCFPFLFYDINLERITPVKIHPYVMNSLVLSQIDFSEASKELLQIRSLTQSLKGELNLIFQNIDFRTEKESNAYLDLLIQLNEA